MRINSAYYADDLWSALEHTRDMHPILSGEAELLSVALGLGAREVEGWSLRESLLARRAVPVKPAVVLEFKELIKKGIDPLGEAFCSLRTPEMRRAKGATYTPPTVVEAMVSWAAATGLNPARVVEPGAGSARFLQAAAIAFPRARLIGIETDPLAAIIARGNLAATGIAGRSAICVADYRTIVLPEIDGQTLYIGNPPYVRHHQLDRATKNWLSEKGRDLDVPVSQLAGLHAYFFLATALKARKNDFGVFITSAEWLDVNYGALVRRLFLRNLGGQGITIVEPTTRTFEDADTTAAITQFVVGSKPNRIRIQHAQSVTQKGALSSGSWLPRRTLETEVRWSVLTRTPKERREGYIELGELCRVHRGQVTGANRVWIAGPHSSMLPDSVLFASVTRARELLAAGDALQDPSKLRSVIDIPAEMAVLDRDARKRVESFLSLARSMGADETYIARNRRPWWSVGLRAPAPILATYMARRAPKFVRNLAGARHINIAHGLYPFKPLDSTTLDYLARYLSSQVSMAEGRTYAGGLTKFEPREMERILIPSPELIRMSEWR